MILELPKIKSDTVSTVSPSISHEVMEYRVAIKHGIKTVQGEVGSWWTEGAHHFSAHLSSTHLLVHFGTGSWNLAFRRQARERTGIGCVETS